MIGSWPLNRTLHGKSAMPDEYLTGRYEHIASARKRLELLPEPQEQVKKRAATAKALRSAIEAKREKEAANPHLGSTGKRRYIEDF